MERIEMDIIVKIPGQPVAFTTLVLQDAYKTYGLIEEGVFIPLIEADSHQFASYVNAILQESNKQWNLDISNVIWSIIDAAQVTLSRKYRPAWIDTDKVDMAKARDIFRDELRQKRRPIFEKLDEQYLRADESGDLEEKERIVSLKQELRGLPELAVIEEATTIEELESIKLEILDK